MISWKQTLRVFHASLHSEKTRPRGLEIDVIARAQLRPITFHELYPAREMRADIHPDGDVLPVRFRAGSDRVAEVMLDRVWRHIAQLRDAAITRETRRVPTKLADHGVVRMLIRRRYRAEENVGSDNTDMARESEPIRV